MLLAALLAALVSAQPAPAPAAPALDPALEQQAKQLEAMLIAPCCWSQQVSVHQSAAADEIKRDIRRRLSEGRTRQEILDAYVSQFGERILAEPPARGFSGTLYVLPVVLLVLTAAVLSVVVKRMTRRQTVAASPGEAGTTTGEYEERLDDELRDLD